jgi:prepilin-type N-terminal cleavage/methylation domain-containing protein
MRQRTRPAFTLIELLVVIAIIGILAAILLVGVIPALRQGPRLKVVADIREMSGALDNFKAKWNVYPPSKITLCSDVSKVDAVSITYLGAIWQRLDWSQKPDWSGTGSSAAFTLEGDQCLVFFLGGIPDPTTPGCRGFSTNPTNPTSLATGDKISFYNFETARLYARTGTPFYSYQDAWGTNQPYAYFSAGKNRDGYNVAPSTTVPGALGDCPSLMKLGAYFQTGTNPTRFFESIRFQIISAGRDGMFGPGGTWSAANATAIPATGKDDQVNFYDFELGVAQ